MLGDGWEMRVRRGDRGEEGRALRMGVREGTYGTIDHILVSRAVVNVYCYAT